MAEEEIKKEAPVETPKSTDTANKEKGLDKSVEELTGGKYKTAEDLAKAYKEAESTIGKQSDEVKQVREFMSVAQPVFDVIKDDPTLFKAIDEKLRKDTPKDADAKDKTTNQEEVVTATRDVLRMRFEEQHGFSKLSADEQKKLRSAIGNEIFELTGKDINGIDLRRLSPVLEKAYILAKDSITDKSTQEAIAAADKTDASISSIPSSGGKSEGVLTPEEAKVAEKLGITREQYLSKKNK
jgi:hypothetical protein